MVLGHLTLECVGEVVCNIEYNVFGCDRGICEVFVPVENRAGHSCYTCQLDPQFPALIVIEGCAKPIGIDAVFRKGYVSVGLLVDEGEGFYANGGEWHCVVVMGAIEVGIYGDWRGCA